MVLFVFPSIRLLLLHQTLICIMKPVFVALFTLLVSGALAQTEAITKNAVFLNFEEFKNNAPSIHPIKIFLEQTGEDKYTLKYQVDSTGTTEKYQKRVWAFSDSNDVYIKYQGHYAKFMTIGKLSVFKYFQEFKSKWSSSGIMGVPPTRQVTPEGERFYILDASTGNISMLKLSVAKKLIADDTELLNELNQQSEYNQDRDKLSYIRRYNERHPQ